jgi:hypothetical protein
MTNQHPSPTGLALLAPKAKTGLAPGAKPLPLGLAAMLLVGCALAEEPGSARQGLLPFTAQLETVASQTRMGGFQVNIFQLRSALPLAQAQQQLMRYWQAQPTSLVQHTTSGPWQLVSVKQAHRTINYQLQGSNDQPVFGLIAIWSTAPVSQPCKSVLWPAEFLVSRCIEQAEHQQQVIHEQLIFTGSIKQAWDRLSKVLLTNGLSPAPGQNFNQGPVRSMFFVGQGLEISLTALQTSSGVQIMSISRTSKRGSHE